MESVGNPSHAPFAISGSRWLINSSLRKWAARCSELDVRTFGEPVVTDTSPAPAGANLTDCRSDTCRSRYLVRNPAGTRDRREHELVQENLTPATPPSCLISCAARSIRMTMHVSTELNTDSARQLNFDQLPRAPWLTDAKCCAVDMLTATSGILGRWPARRLDGPARLPTPADGQTPANPDAEMRAYVSRHPAMGSGRA
jgi:hypothetical protein